MGSESPVSQSGKVGSPALSSMLNLAVWDAILPHQVRTHTLGETEKFRNSGMMREEVLAPRRVIGSPQAPEEEIGVAEISRGGEGARHQVGQGKGAAAEGSKMSRVTSPPS